MLDRILITSEEDTIGIIPDPRGIEGFTCIGYRNGGVTYLPHDFFRSWQDKPTQPGRLKIGRCSSFGTGSFVKFDNEEQIVTIGKYVSAGQRVILLVDSNHEMECLSTCQFSAFDKEMRNPMPAAKKTIIIGNDVWIGDEVMIMGNTVISDGCVIGARSLVPCDFVTEPYGIYAGMPARLIRHRFNEGIRNRLTKLKWWDKPFSWIKENNDLFMMQVNGNLLNSLENG